MERRYSSEFIVQNMLRDYQQEMLDRLNKAWKRNRSVMVQMPTGTGKTHLMAAAIKQFIGHGSKSAAHGSKSAAHGSKSVVGGRVLVVAHRRELIDQIIATLHSFGIDAGDNPVVVESIQKLSRAEANYEPCTMNYELVVVDEAHHALAKTYRMLWDRWPKAKFLGLTATPCRLSGEAFTELFDTLLQSWTIQEFIDKGYLSDFEYVSASPDSQAMRQIRRLTKRGADGDYQTKEMAMVMDVPESTAHLYRTYRAFANGKKGIVYAIDRQHASHIADYYAQQGVRCTVIDSRTPAKERQRMVENYRRTAAGDGRQTIDVLVNVDIFGEGFDVPEVEFIQLARPTLSLSKYLQQVGRGMRISEGKQQVVILDNVGLYQLFGLPTVDRDWRTTFYGREAGKGMQGLERCVVVDEPQATEEDKELVNLEMVRIKKSGKRHAGLEVFLQDGRYGVMRNGKIACPARFRHIERLDKHSGFFALGTYRKRDEREPDRTVDVTTVIDRKGQDLGIRLYGFVRWNEKGYFKAEGEGAYRYGVHCWDPVGNSYYDIDPDFHTVGGVEIGYAYDHHHSNDLCLKLRYSTGTVSPRFNEREMFCNRHIIIARNYLIVKSDHNHSYDICGYLDNSILVKSDEQYGYQQIYLDGKKGSLFRHIPPDASYVLNVRQLGLKRPG